MNIKQNPASSLIYHLTKIPHNIFTMNYEERISHLNKIRQCVKEIKKQMDQLPRSEKDLTDLNLLNFPMPVFMMAYYGFSIKDILEDVVSLYRDVFSSYIKQVDAKFSCKDPYKKPYKKILFCSGRLLSNSSVYKSTYGIIDHLAKVPDFHVDVMTKFPLAEDVGKSYSNCKNILRIGSIQNNIDIIGGGRYDVVIYPDMNMDESTSCIGMFRLAPFQVTTFGHSETSGLADYFVTSKSYEISTVDNNYTEKVVSFDSLALKYRKINLNDYAQEFKTRQYFQIPEKSNVYCCNSSCFKMGREMFEIFKGILDNDKSAVIVLTKLNIPSWDALFFNSLDQELPLEYQNRIRFLSRLNFVENLNLLYLSDVFIESYPFGNMNSTLECFAVGLPVVSMPTTKINGRFTYGYYQKIGLDREYCVSNIKDYISKAVEIATKKDKSKREELIEKSKILFEEEKSVKDWEDFLRNL